MVTPIFLFRRLSLIERELLFSCCSRSYFSKMASKKRFSDKTQNLILNNSLPAFLSLDFRPI